MSADRRLHAHSYHRDVALQEPDETVLLRRVNRMSADRRLHARPYHFDIALQGPDETDFFDV